MISHVSIQGLDEVEKLLARVKNGSKKATTRALNKGLSKAKTVAVDTIYKEVNLTKTVIRQTITERKATYTNATCYLRARDKRGVPLYDKSKAWKIKGQVPGMHFGGRRSQKGFSALFKRRKGRIQFHEKFKQAGFVATMANGHTNIFIRTGKRRANPRKGNPRDESIKGIWSSSPPMVLQDEERMGPVLQSASQAAQAELDRQVQLILSGIQGL
ncbi:minor tail protein Z (GPZ) [Desulfobotulus alkaliphilus]|uniref:Minor tail protein Z (GPZ) n=1 Tax=Desulfobotulus alkaliphilus TaxID=622671 RepID=A0A562RHH2_9BACT|nr:phage tail protein [Desulfobotulus alkaliphilus]TWI68552.1 minor tail protein Z (GPZ) [Desulfobotulus alkaliphilus]